MKPDGQIVQLEYPAHFYGHMLSCYGPGTASQIQSRLPEGSIAQFKFDRSEAARVYDKLAKLGVVTKQGKWYEIDSNVKLVDGGPTLKSKILQTIVVKK